MGAPLVIAVDMDGVIYDFAAALRNHLHLNEGVDRTTMPEPTKWEFWDEWGMTESEWVAACTRGVEMGIVFRTGEPVGDAVAALRALANAGHIIHLVTSRFFGGPLAYAHTALWLKDWAIPHHSLTFTRNKGAIAADVAVDDHVDNVLQYAQAGTVCALWDQPWNRYANLPRVSSWAEFLRGVALRSSAVEEANKIPEQPIVVSSRLVGPNGAAL
jgi:5'(3')-deoxyribonucleotidase